MLTALDNKLDYELLGIQDKKKKKRNFNLYNIHQKVYLLFKRNTFFFQYEIQNCICRVWKYVSGDNILKLGFTRNIETVSMVHCGWLNNEPKRYLIPNPWNL